MNCHFRIVEQLESFCSFHYIALIFLLHKQSITEMIFFGDNDEQIDYPFSFLFKTQGHKYFSFLISLYGMNILFGTGFMEWIYLSSNYFDSFIVDTIVCVYWPILPPSHLVWLRIKDNHIILMCSTVSAIFLFYQLPSESL